MEKRKCPECGFEIIGRADKIFCSDQCRNNYNNRLRRDTDAYVRKINHILRTNRRILAGLNPNGKARVHRKFLAEKGFNFDYFTSTYTTKSGKTYYFCYEQGYLPDAEDDYLTLVIHWDYRKKAGH
ncbi:MAG: hypothetical protein Kow00127_07730 [Bacteroidales bacterium]